MIYTFRIYYIFETFILYETDKVVLKQTDKLIKSSCGIFNLKKTFLIKVVGDFIC